MATHIALLRGVNVGGIRIAMADLRACLAGLGFEDVKTILASGNAVFRTGRRASAAMKAEIEAALGEAFGYEAWIVLIAPARLQTIIDAYPFDENNASRQPYVVLASRKAPLDELRTRAGKLDPEIERIADGDGVIYWEVERGASTESDFGKLGSSPCFKSTTTTRNLRTLRKILAAAE